MSGLFKRRKAASSEDESMRGKVKSVASAAASESESVGTSGGEGVTLIARSARLVGNLSFDDQLHINGRVEGDVTASGENSTVVVCDSGVVKGEIRAPNVIIDGLVEGDVFGTSRVELAARARVVGDVHYNLVEMQLGSVVNGQMVSLADEVSEAKLVQSENKDSILDELDPAGDAGQQPV